MIRVKCNSYQGVGEDWEVLSHYELIKPQWEHIINAIYKAGGNARHKICPVCKSNTLIFNYGRGENND